MNLNINNNKNNNIIIIKKYIFIDITPKQESTIENI